MGWMAVLSEVHICVLGRESYINWLSAIGYSRLLPSEASIRDPLLPQSFDSDVIYLAWAHVNLGKSVQRRVFTHRVVSPNHTFVSAVDVKPNAFGRLFTTENDLVPMHINLDPRVGQI